MQQRVSYSSKLVVEINSRTYRCDGSFSKRPSIRSFTPTFTSALSPTPSDEFREGGERGPARTNARGKEGGKEGRKEWENKGGRLS